jgi:hypothetical protein
VTKTVAAAATPQKVPPQAAFELALCCTILSAGSIGELGAARPAMGLREVSTPAAALLGLPLSMAEAGVGLPLSMTDAGVGLPLSMTDAGVGPSSGPSVVATTMGPACISAAGCTATMSNIHQWTSWDVTQLEYCLDIWLPILSLVASSLGHDYRLSWESHDHFWDENAFLFRSFAVPATSDVGQNKVRHHCESRWDGVLAKVWICYGMCN